jgi:hypothetical protein
MRKARAISHSEIVPSEPWSHLNADVPLPTCHRGMEHSHCADVCLFDLLPCADSSDCADEVSLGTHPNLKFLPWSNFLFRCYVANEKPKGFPLAPWHLTVFCLSWPV